MAIQPRKSYAVEEYLALEREAQSKSEYLGGEIYAMAGASARHNLITANLLAELVPGLRARSCRGYASDLRVKVERTGLFTYPDITVVCGRPEMAAEDSETLINPTLIVEVLSSSTESYDRGRKFAHYQQVESLQEYVLVAQDQPRIESFLRLHDGSWRYTVAEGAEATLRLDSVGCELRLANVYALVEFEMSEGSTKGQ